jgi:hypothetical protein
MKWDAVVGARLSPTGRRAKGMTVGSQRVWGTATGEAEDGYSVYGAMHILIKKFFN